MEYLGIDIGGTYIKYGMIDENNTIIRQWKKETLLFEEKDAFYDYICDGLDLKMWHAPELARRECWRKILRSSQKRRRTSV